MHFTPPPPPHTHTQAKAGHSVNLEDLPPVIITGPMTGAGSVGGATGGKSGGNDEFELSEEDLAAWAGSLEDDREKPGAGVCMCVCVLCVWCVCVHIYSH